MSEIIEGNGYLRDMPGRTPVRINYGTPLVVSFEPEPTGEKAGYLDPESQYKNQPSPPQGLDILVRQRVRSRNRKITIAANEQTRRGYPW